MNDLLLQSAKNEAQTFKNRIDENDNLSTFSIGYVSGLRGAAWFQEDTETHAAIDAIISDMLNYHHDHASK